VRADAQRNREAIVAAALRLLTARGARVSMEEIARAAGLGVGTLYRHFPDRQALLEHIAVDTLTRLVASSRAVAAEDVPRWDALRRIVDRCVDLPLSLIRDLTITTSTDPERARLAREHNDLLERLVAQAQEEGALRRDIPSSEVVELLQVAVCRPGTRDDDHLVTVVMDGLRAEAQHSCGRVRGAAGNLRP
jgi:AcrR family transcriptional regulator